MLTGRLVGESLKPGSKLDGLPLRLHSVASIEIAAHAAAQPSRWTLLDFEADDEAAAELAAALAQCLDPGPWYASFSTADEAYVVFADRVFRYQRGDRSGRARAAQYALAVGVPELQLVWSD
jgi:hypothetical protein